MSCTINTYENENNLILNNLFNFIPPPSLPSDLKARKVKMKKESGDKKSDNETEDLFSNIESDLLDSGLVDESEEF